MDYQILTRNTSRVHELSPGVWVGMGGCEADIVALVDALRVQARLYAWKRGGKTIGLEAMAHLLSTVLYGRRTMPYYAFCVLAGVDERGAAGQRTVGGPGRRAQMCFRGRQSRC